MKKTLLFLILSILITTCEGQVEPDVCFYSQEIVDSLQKVIDERIETNNNLVLINDSLLNRISLLTDSISKLGQNVSSSDSIFYGNKELKIVALDSTEFNVFVKKENRNTWYEISHEDKKIKLDYIEDSLKIFIGKGDTSTLYLELYMPFIKLLQNIQHVGN